MASKVRFGFGFVPHHPYTISCLTGPVNTMNQRADATTNAPWAIRMRPPGGGLLKRSLNAKAVYKMVAVSRRALPQTITKWNRLKGPSTHR